MENLGWVSSFLSAWRQRLFDQHLRALTGRRRSAYRPMACPVSEQATQNPSEITDTPKTCQEVFTFFGTQDVVVFESKDRPNHKM